ncbi:hypothetical protein ACTXT7_003484 [Hymenolepis weldensis]
MAITRRWLKFVAFLAVGCTIFMMCRFSTANIWILPYDESCKWPPSDVNDITVNGTYDIALCVRLSSDFILDNQPKKYTLKDLFNVSESNETVTFESLPYLSPEIWKKVKYPRIYDTYPQDVPMKEIVANIKAGRPVSYKRDPVSKHGKYL